MKYIIFFLFVLGYTTQSHALTWAPINSPTTANIKSCSFISPDTGWVITDDFIYKTTDGGASWVSQPFPADPAHDVRFCNTVDFINANVGIIACGNYLYSGHDPNQVSDFLWTNDGGATWTYRNLGWSEDYILDARLCSPTTAYGVGQYGSLTRTDDGGVTWTVMSYVSQYTGQRLFPLNTDSLYYAGVANISNDAAFGFIRNGTWSASTIVNTSFTTFFISLYFFNPLKGWMCGSGGMLYKTIDGGTNWTAGSSGVTDNINDITFTNDTNGWFITNAGKIYRTINSGAFWYTEYTGSAVLTDITITGTTGYAVGYGGLILKTDLTTSLPEQGNADAMLLSPNPATDQLHVFINDILPGKTSLCIYNSLGEPVMEQEVMENSSAIDISGLAEGMYFVSVKNGSARSARKIVISR